MLTLIAVMLLLLLATAVFVVMPLIGGDDAKLPGTPKAGARPKGARRA